jgi:hypothetical protein
MGIVNVIDTYIINLREREDRLKHAKKQFKGRSEFKVSYLNFTKHNDGRLGLWQNIITIIKHAEESEAQQILICEDDHEFTDNYNSKQLFDHIKKGNECCVDVLLGGVSWFNNAVSIPDGMFWLDQFSGLQFTVIFRRFFKKILESNFIIGDIADGKISSLTDSKLVIYPFISVQKEFGYSDVTSGNDIAGFVDYSFQNTSEMFERLNKVNAFYQAISIDNQVDNIYLDHFIIPVYVMPSTTLHNKATISQFEGKPEFEVNFLGLPLNRTENIHSDCFEEIINKAIQNDDDVIIVCSSNHVFTSNYSKESLLKNILIANDLGALVLFGGVGSFQTAVPITEGLFWVDNIHTAEFVVLFKPIFSKLLKEIDPAHSTLDRRLSELTTHKMIIYPFISEQKVLPNIHHDLKNYESKVIDKGHLDLDRMIAAQKQYDII